MNKNKTLRNITFFSWKTTNKLTKENYVLYLIKKEKCYG
jgi:hypothetical protein